MSNLNFIEYNKNTIKFNENNFIKIKSNIIEKIISDPVVSYNDDKTLNIKADNVIYKIYVGDI